MPSLFYRHSERALYAQSPNCLSYSSSCRFPRSRPFSIHPTSYRGVCGCIGGCVTRAQAEGSMTFREVTQHLLFQFVEEAPSRRESDNSLTRRDRVWPGPVPTAKDWGLCQDSECSLDLLETAGDICARIPCVLSGESQAIQVVFTMTHPSRPPLVLGGHKPWNHKMSIIRRPTSHKSKKDQVLNSVGKTSNESSHRILACDLETSEGMHEHRPTSTRPPAS